MTLAKILLPHALAGVSILLALILATPPGPGMAAWITGIFGLCVLVVAAIIDFRLATQGQKEFRKGPLNRPKIEIYMRELISGAGNVAIFTRDMSWASHEIMGFLYAKAKTDDLTIFMQKSTVQSSQLIQAGARVYYYGDALHLPINTRFTLINLDSQNVELALGRTKMNIHRITRHHERDDPALLLAQDMLTVFRQTLTRADAEVEER